MSNENNWRIVEKDGSVLLKVVDFPAEFVGMESSALHRKLKTLGIKGVN